MTLSPEQFDQILLKKDFEERFKDLATKEDIRSLQVTLDYIAKKFGDHEVEHAANLAVHDRFEARISKLESAS